MGMLNDFISSLDDGCRASAGSSWAALSKELVEPGNVCQRIRMPD